MKVALAAKDSAGDLAIDFAIKSKIAMGKCKDAGVALEHQILNRDCRCAGQQCTQLMVGSIGVGLLLGVRSRAD